MCNRFIGSLDFAPKDIDNPYIWKLEQPLAYVHNHYLIIMPKDIPIDGASIPEPLQLIFGHPFERANAWMSLPHDYGYNDKAVVIDLNKTSMTADVAYQLYIDGVNMRPWYANTAHLDRKWWDEVLASAGKTMSVNRLKLWLMHKGVRIGGIIPWRNGHRTP